MKTIITSLVIVSFLTYGCEVIEMDPVPASVDGFCMMSDNKVIVSHNDFEYYDFSTHLIYLKDNKSFSEDIQGIAGFTVYADCVKIYSGVTLPSFSSLLTAGPVINTFPSFYGDYIISIDFISIKDSLGNVTPDPRGDARIIEALKKYDQYRSGLDCEIISVHYSQNNVTVELRLTNSDSFNYYYLDPYKMGVGLFHLFTNGLYLYDFTNKQNYTHQIGIVEPVPCYAWKTDWLSLIRSKESKKIIFTYDKFEIVPPGLYRATFVFPGLSSQVDKEDIQHDNGRIWLGEVKVIKEINID